MLLLEEEDYIFKNNNLVKIGFVHMGEKEQGPVIHNLKIKSIQLMQKLNNIDWLQFEPVYHIRKIDKQFQYLIKVNRNLDFFIIIYSRKM